jgi:drug/metabolite transporter (DMT)-like permease
MLCTARRGRCFFVLYCRVLRYAPRRDTLDYGFHREEGKHIMWMAYALLAAVCFGFRGILYHWTSQQPMNRNLMLFGVFCTGGLLCFAASLLLQQSWSTASLIGIWMGCFSFAASAAIYRGFAVGKASLVAVLTGLSPVVVAVFAYVLWGETITGWKLVGFGIILLSVILLRYSNDLTWKDLKGAQWGLLAMLCFGLNDLTSKQSTLLGAATLPTLTCMFMTGAALFGVWWRAARRRHLAEAAVTVETRTETAASIDIAWSERKTFLWGMAVGLTNSFGMMTILAAFTYGVTGLVSAVAALNVLIILVYTRLFTKEKFKRLELAGIALSLFGIMMLRLFPG